MKKTFLFTLLIFALILSACSGTASASQASSTQESTALPTATELIVGTLKLEGTDQAVTADQAKELLMLWQVYQELSNNDTAAQAEFDGVIDQIQGTMTTEQMKAITAMKLTQSDVFALMQEKGLSAGQPQQSSSSSSTRSGGNFTPQNGGMAGGPPDAGMAGGAPPAGGVGGMGGAGSNTSTGQTQSTGTGLSAGRSAGVPSVLVDALIQVLEKKAGA